LVSSNLERRKPVLIVIAGPNGSGKTSLTEQVLSHSWIQDCVYINPDNIARDQFGDWNSPTATLQAAQYADRLRWECLEQKRSLAFESVLSAVDKVAFIQTAKEKGFFIRLFFVGTKHPAINAARVAQRVLEGGHDVPIPKIISRYSKSISNCLAVTMLADRAYIYDNSVEQAVPRLLFKCKNAQVAKVYSKVEDWAALILENIPAKDSG
jgi:predicted ABC-type ATPase